MTYHRVIFNFQFFPGIILLLYTMQYGKVYHNCIIPNNKIWELIYDCIAKGICGKYFTNNSQQVLCGDDETYVV